MTKMIPDHYLVHGDGLTEVRAQLRKNVARLDSVAEAWLKGYRVAKTRGDAGNSLRVMNDVLDGWRRQKALG